MVPLRKQEFKVKLKKRTTKVKESRVAEANKINIDEYEVQNKQSWTHDHE